MHDEGVSSNDSLSTPLLQLQLPCSVCGVSGPGFWNVVVSDLALLHLSFGSNNELITLKPPQTFPPGIGLFFGTRACSFIQILAALGTQSFARLLAQKLEGHGQ